MSTAREVWFAEEAYITIYPEGSGTATHTCLYVQNVSVKNSTELVVAGQPGAAAQDIYSIPGPVDCSIGELFWKAATQWTPFLDSQARWKVVIQNINSRYPTADNDTITLRNAAVVSPSIAWQQNANQVNTLDFRAESVE